MKRWNLLGASIFAGMVFLLAVSCFSQEEGKDTNLERIFHRGNDYYEKGEYSKAIAEYEKIAAAGYESGPLYFNLGNAYFKTGVLGKAILNYERAKRLIPRDADLEANYRFARASVKGRIQKKSGIWSLRPVRLYAENFTVNELLWITSGIYVLVILLFAALVRYPQMRRRLILPILLIFFFGIYNSSIAWHEVGGIGKDAIVISPEAESLYGPYDSATAFFKLYEGMKIRVVKDKADWCKIERPDGKAGWVKKSEVKII